MFPPFLYKLVTFHNFQSKTCLKDPIEPLIKSFLFRMYSAYHRQSFVKNMKLTAGTDYIMGNKKVTNITALHTLQGKSHDESCFSMVLFLMQLF